jgi:outer membrane lipoprotein-sorting protein
MSSISYSIKITILALIIGLSPVSAQSLDEIINNYIVAMGGAEKLGKLNSLKISADVEMMNTKMPVTTTVVQNKGFRTETVIQGKTIIQAVYGNKGWMINPMAGQEKAVALPEAAIKPMTSQTDLTGLYNYKEKGYTLSLDGEEDLLGAKVFKITSTMKNGVKQTSYISKDTWYILKVEATVPVNGEEIKTENSQSDFKQVDGITFPFSSEISTSAIPGMKMVNKISTVEVNPKIDEKIFEMPL